MPGERTGATRPHGAAKTGTAPTATFTPATLGLHPASAEQGLARGQLLFGAGTGAGRGGRSQFPLVRGGGGVGTSSRALFLAGRRRSRVRLIRFH